MTGWNVTTDDRDKWRFVASPDSTGWQWKRKEERNL